MPADRFALALASLVSLLAAPAAAAVFTVTTTADDGPGSLRQAILDANASEGADEIEFAIPAPDCSAQGVCRIELASLLPALSDVVTIDGTTQPRHGTAPENLCSNPFVSSFLRIEVLGFAGSGSLEPVFAVTSLEPSTIRGLAIAGPGLAIAVSSAGAHRIQCNHIGSNGPGDAFVDLGFAGIVIDTLGSGAIVGTDGDGVDDLAEMNLLVPTAAYGVYVNANDDNRISGNVFGRSSDGSTVLGCATAIHIRQGSSRNLVGSDEDGLSDDLEANVIDNCTRGIQVPNQSAGSDNRVVRNRLGDLAGNQVAIELADGAGTLVRNNGIRQGELGIRVAGAATLAPGSEGNCLEGNTLGLRHEGDAAIVFERNWWNAADGPGGDGPGSGDGIETTGAGSLDVEPFHTAGCVFVPEPAALAAGLAGFAALGLVGRRRRCAASSSA